MVYVKMVNGVSIKELPLNWSDLSFFLYCCDQCTWKSNPMSNQEWKEIKVAGVKHDWENECSVASHMVCWVTKFHYVANQMVFHPLTCSTDLKAWWKYTRNTVSAKVLVAWNGRFWAGLCARALARCRIVLWDSSGDKFVTSKTLECRSPLNA